MFEVKSKISQEYGKKRRLVQGTKKGHGGGDEGFVDIFQEGDILQGGEWAGM